MKKQVRRLRNNKLIVIGLIFLIAIIFLCVLVLKQSVIGNVVLDEDSILVEFRDNITGCLLEGDIYVDNQYLGKTNDGIYFLSGSEYNKMFIHYSLLRLSGETGDCFGNDKNLPFVSVWDVINFDDNFKNNINVFLSSEIMPRQPDYYSEMIGFVRPNEAKIYLSEINLGADTLENNLDKIVRYGKIKYISDLKLFGEEDYWQTPKETFEKKQGDCEDWSLAAVSLARAYDPLLDCYVLVSQNHAGVFCYFGNNYFIYDQQGVKKLDNLKVDFSEKQNIQFLRDMLLNYFEIVSDSPDGKIVPASERQVIAIFNDKEFIRFEENEDFIEWMFSLKEEGIQFSPVDKEIKNDNWFMNFLKRVFMIGI